ncbi:MAG: GntR family transcriptional regulator [Phycisphaeraceae bacterium]|nr:GntR family transcriptional regulator [Phycisphaeraceae bacterium]
MQKKPKATQVLTQQAYRLLKDDLIDARFAPGEDLPSLRKMIQMYGFKRDTLWRAIKQLESENWLKASTSLRFCVAPEVADSLLPKLSIVFMALGTECILHHLFQRVYDTLVAHGPRMNLHTTLQLVDSNSDIKKLEQLAEADLILLSSDLTGRLPEVQSFGKPIIGINTSKSLHLPYAIDTDNFLGGQMACTPLLASNPEYVLIITIDSQNQGPGESLAYVH